MKINIFGFVYISLAIAGCGGSSQILRETIPGAEGKSFYRTSVTSHNIDLIKADDPTVDSAVKFVSRGRREMPDKNSDDLFDENAYIFEVQYRDGQTLEIWGHSKFENEMAVRKNVEPVAQAIGKLPIEMRMKLNHVVLHKGDSSAFAESEGHFFVLYSGNISTRLKEQHLEETIFHEAIHATLDIDLLEDSDWKQAQLRDGTFVTEYAKSRPNKEDLAESAIFAYTSLRHPDRLPETLQAWLERNMRHRLDYLFAIFGSMTIPK